MTSVSATAICRFIERLNREGVCIHGFELRVDGQARAEGYWQPFRRGEPHRMYSVSKSIVSLAIGLLIADGKLRLTDKIADFFPEYLPEAPDPRLLRLTLRDMLRMATCYRKTTYREGVDRDWAQTFFTAAPTHEPGVMFHYDTSCSQVLCALVQKLTNRPIVAFLTERLFAPLGCTDAIRWLTDPSGVPQGGTGLLMSLRDLGKVAQCVLDGGNGLLPAEYLRAATTRQIQTDGRDAPEEQFGYGYQFWMTRHGWAMYGMGGQMAIACPAERVLLCTIADTRLQGGVQMLYDAFFEEIMAHLGEVGLPADEARLQNLCAALSYPALPHTAGTWRVTDAEFQVRGESGLRRVRFAARAVTFVWADGADCFAWGAWGETVRGRWSDGEETLSSAALTPDGALHLRVQRIGDAPCGIELYCYPKGDTISIRMKRSADPMTNRYDGVVWGERIEKGAHGGCAPSGIINREF